MRKECSFQIGKSGEVSKVMVPEGSEHEDYLSHLSDSHLSKNKRKTRRKNKRTEDNVQPHVSKSDNKIIFLHALYFTLLSKMTFPPLSPITRI